jgi:2-polyprenyl-6-methoxyphenol hydroxylase-like FAD-dependent oxidoreductase
MGISLIGVAHQEHKAHIVLPVINMKALIFGGGPAGLATALRLKQALGVHPVIYEVRSEPTTLGGAVQLPPNGLRLMEQLGIDPALHATMTPKGLVAMSPHTALADRLYWFFSRSVPIPDSGSRDGWEAFGKHEVDGFKNTLLETLADATGDWNDKLREVIHRTEMVKFYPIYKMPTGSK